MPPRLIRIGESVYEPIGDDGPDGSLFLLNKSGIVRRRITDLERQLARARAELAALERRDAVTADVVG
jgi:hypothetical protein